MEYRYADRDQSWAAKARCASKPDLLFTEGADQRDVRMICLSCEVRLECLAEALETGSSFGVWGGLTERERRAMLRHFHSVEDWKSWLMDSDEALAVELRSPKVPHVLAYVRQAKQEETRASA